MCLKKLRHAMIFFFFFFDRIYMLSPDCRGERDSTHAVQNCILLSKRQLEISVTEYQGIYY